MILCVAIWRASGVGVGDAQLEIFEGWEITLPAEGVIRIEFIADFVAPLSN